MSVLFPKSYKNYIISISVRKPKETGVIYILIAILFYVHLMVNVAAILIFFSRFTRSRFTRIEFEGQIKVISLQ